MQTMRPDRPALFVCAALLAVLALGCDALVDRPGLPLDFGAPYEVLFGTTATATDGLVSSTPFVDSSGTLHVAVQFSGGCAEHSFFADYSLHETTATIWLVHANNGDLCEALQREAVMVNLPGSVLEKERLVLADPNGREESIARFDNPVGGP